MLPPAAPTTHESTERIAVGRPITFSVRSTVRPPLTTSRSSSCRRTPARCPSVSASWCSAAATPAAGPEPIVNDGARAERLEAHRAAVAAQHEQRHVDAARSCSTSRRSRAVRSHQRQDRGVDRGRPCAAPGRRRRQLVAGAGRQTARAGPLRRPAPRARARRPRSAALTASAVQPAADSGRARRRRAAPSARRWRRGRRARCAARGRARAPRRRPAVRLRARRRSGAAPMPITPTRATSPSSSAFIACVVENATSSTARASSPSRRAARGAPARRRRSRRPRASWVVGTTAWARSASGCGTTATAFVKVPPTSTPTRRHRAADSRHAAAALRDRCAGGARGSHANM